VIGLVQGNALTIPLADKSVHCIVTSPPYWGLRSYAGTATWEGGAEGCDHEAARHKNRFDYPLQEDSIVYQGTNAGSAFSRYDTTCPTCSARRVDAQLGSEPLHDCLSWARGEEPCGLCYICHMRQVARECWRVLRDDGTMFWNIADSYAGSGRDQNPNGIQKGNRGTVNFEPNFFTSYVPPGLKPKDKCGIPERTALAFQAEGWYWRSGITWIKPNPMPESVKDRPTKSTEMIYLFTKSERYYYDAEAVREDAAAWNEAGFRNGINDEYTTGGKPGVSKPRAGRNLRDAWTIATAPYPGQHFATFPQELPRRCIKAGSRKGDIILDPFSGAATTGIVARELGRHYIGLELSGEYLQQSRDRLGMTALEEWGGNGKVHAADLSDLPMFAEGQP